MRTPTAVPSTPLLESLEDATRIVRAALPPTPQYRWPLLEQRVGAEVWVKHEHHLFCGAFKVRGGLVYFDHLMRTDPGVFGVVAATRGNHGQAVAFAARRHGVAACIVVPHGNSTEKNAAMMALGAELIEHGEDFQASLEFAHELAQGRGWHFVPSFHPMLARGAATGALELLRAAPPLDAVYVPIGLGSNICGMLEARDALGLATQVIGVVAEGAPAMLQSLEHGHVVSADARTRIADGLACRTPHPDAYARIAGGVERVISVTDEDVEEAMRVLFHDCHSVAEGAGAASLAGLLAEREAMRGRRVGVLLTGSNVDTDVFARVVSGRQPTGT